MPYLLGAFVPLLLLAGLVFGVWTLMKSAGVGRSNQADAAPVDTAEVAKSVALYFGLLVAFIACTVGVIDLVQYFFDDANRLAGSNSDLARGLSILLVGVPVFGVLARTAGNRFDRASAVSSDHPDLGWSSLYLVAALSISLIAVLVSVAQIAEGWGSGSNSVQSGTVVQLIVWFGAWALHWFVGRPRFAIRGDAHLAIGSIAGLAMMLSGIGGALYRTLERGYESVFADSLAVSSDTLQWVIIGAAGAATWVWHWLLHFDASGSVEGDRRRSPLWFFTVVVAGVVPGLITILISVTTMVGGLLVWVMGSTTDSAQDYFSPAPGLVAALLVGVLTWAYHRWSLTRGGEPERNEALRFHDYAVAAVGLGAVCWAFAILIWQLLSAISATTYLARAESPVNGLIIVITILTVAAALWWWQWNQIETHRRASPVEESDSRWRKLYLIGGLLIAGLVLSINTIRVLFVLLRDLIDGQLGADTIEEIASPFGWAVAVAGAVWFHLGVWRADRAVLAAVMPPPPRPPQPPAPTPASVAGAAAGIGRCGVAARFGRLEFTPRRRVAADCDRGGPWRDLHLQRAAFVDEAVNYGTVEVPSLQESFAECIDRLGRSETVVAVVDRRIVGAGSLRSYRDGGPDIERLMVVPDRRRSGIAQLVLGELEARAQARGEDAVQLIVGAIVDEARQLYAGQGFTFVSQSQDPGGPLLLTLRKEFSPENG